ncbi:hypothetical protein [Haloferula sp. BvORR071]|uniref:hypothetical protein n=1 Tax=Haloferula sp. BvORR071 TaxID=1396141 RepID=UPI0006985632|nr:hypothetical protein [Haloferula sp. BvORR071]
MNPSKLVPLLALTSLLSLPTFAEETAKPTETPKKEEAPKAPETAPAAALDFGDFGSATLTTKAWEALNAGKHDAVDGYTSKVVELYATKADEMQAGLTEAASADKAHDYWALNDVGTCYFIRAQSKEARGDAKGAIAYYKTLSEKYSFAQCWDTKGWFWKPADAAKSKLKSLEFDSLK